MRAAAALTASAAWRVLAAEGPRAAADRALDRLGEVRRRRSFAPMDALEATLGLPPAAFPVLRLAAAPPAARFGGAQASLLARLDQEEAQRPVALLYARRGAWRLELSEGALRRAAELPAAAPPHPLASVDSELERVVAWAAERCGARLLQIEGAAGLPLGSLLRLAREGLPVLLALHDFALFCPRPHLLEATTGRFCAYCRDPARCAACLAATWPLLAGLPSSGPDARPALSVFQDHRREMSASLLSQAAAAVFPSDFLRRAHAELFPAMPARTAVIPPARPPGPLPPPEQMPRAAPIRRVALVGGAQAHKGAEVFAEAVARLGGSGLSFAVYGGGDTALLRRLHGLPGVLVRGYYRAGSLPRLLRRDGVDLALLLSIVPETYSLALSECRLAGVPALAFDQGAVGDRIRAEGGGLLVDPALGAQGVAACLAALARGEVDLPPVHADPAADSAARVAERWGELYRELGVAA